MMAAYLLDVTTAAKLDDLAAVQTGLRQFNEAHLGAPKGRLAVFLRESPDGTIRGGVVGNLIRDELFIDWLWVADDLRGQGFGARLLAAGERAAAERGVQRVTLNTFSFQALGFYHKQGYQTLVEIPDFMCGESKIYLRKPLSSGS